MLYSISPLDGRYRKRLSFLGKYFSEYALMQTRCLVELKYLLELDMLGIFPPLGSDEKHRIEDAMLNFSETDYQRLKEIEEITNHDVKSCEIFLREKLKLQSPAMLHFGLTSEDINNLSYSSLLRSYVQDVQLPQLRELIVLLVRLAELWQDIPFPARTHGQLASPTTAGKELAVFISRLTRQYRKLKELEFRGKLNGATGNYSAMNTAAPNVDWEVLSERLVESLGLQFNPVTTQIEDHDRWAEYFNLTRVLNNILLDLDQDCWLYISYDYFSEKTKEGEIGSSTMPHKVNPINFENSEGNLSIANALLGLYADKLTRSRLQRDLSDSTVTRNIGVALAHSYLAVSETIRGLNKLKLNQTRCAQELENAPALLAEPYQTILKLAGVDDPYEKLKKLTRGKSIQINQLLELAQQLNISPDIQKQLESLQILNYTGKASEICRNTVNQAKKELNL